MLGAWGAVRKWKLTAAMSPAEIQGMRPDPVEEYILFSFLRAERWCSDRKFSGCGV